MVGRLQDSERAETAATCGGAEQELGTGAVRPRYTTPNTYAARTALPVRLAGEHGRGIAANRGRARGLVCWPRLLCRRAGDRRRPRHPAELTQGSAMRVRRSKVLFARAPGSGRALAEKGATGDGFPLPATGDGSSPAPRVSRGPAERCQRDADALHWITRCVNRGSSADTGVAMGLRQDALPSPLSSARRPGIRAQLGGSPAITLSCVRLSTGPPARSFGRTLSASCTNKLSIVCLQ